LLGALGVLAAGETRASSDHAVCGQPLPTNLAVGVTDRRLLIFKLTEVTDKAKKLIRSIPFTHIVGVSVDVGWSFGMTVVHIEIGFTDGSTVSLEAARPNTNDGQQFAHTLAAATSTLGASPSTM